MSIFGMGLISQCFALLHNLKQLIKPNAGISIHFRALVPNSEQIDVQFLWAALRSSYCTNQFSIETGGIGKGEISEERLLEIQIPLPPLSIQQVIVARWEAAQAEIAALQAQVVDMEGITSCLVSDRLGVPVQKTRTLPKAFALIWKDVERWSVGYIRRAKQDTSGFTHSKYPIVPLSECLIGTMNGYCIRPVPQETPYKMLKLNALTEAGLNLKQSKFIDVPKAIAERFSLHKGDLLICRSVGSYSHIAKCALVEQDSLETLFPDIIIRVRFKKTVLPEYVREVIQTPLGRSYFQSNARTAVGMWKIGAEDIRNFPVPLPPLDVQREIVAQVQAQRQEIARLRAEADHRARQIKADVEAWILGTRSVNEG